MKYMKLYGSIAGGEQVDIDRLHRRIERYRRALRRCARRWKRERETRAASSAPADGRQPPCAVEHLKTGPESPVCARGSAA
jgi:hypothetical protein